MSKYFRIELFNESADRWGAIKRHLSPLPHFQSHSRSHFLSLKPRTNAPIQTMESQGGAKKENMENKAKLGDKRKSILFYFIFFSNFFLLV